MIYQLPPLTSLVDQGDIIDGCPIAFIEQYAPDRPDEIEWEFSTSRVVVLTQTCDLASQKSQFVTVALVLDALELVQQGLLKPADIRGPIRSGRVYGWYFLPKDDGLKLPEMIVDLRQLFTIRRDLLQDVCDQGHRLARITELYRAHLGKHFADTYSRIGLPEPFETE